MSEERGKLLRLLIIHLGAESENSIELLATLTHSLTNFHKIEEKRNDRKDRGDTFDDEKLEQREQRKSKDRKQQKKQQQHIPAQHRAKLIILGYKP